jgi:hypothetical protein
VQPLRSRPTVDDLDGGVEDEEEFGAPLFASKRKAEPVNVGLASLDGRRFDVVSSL